MSRTRLSADRYVDLLRAEGEALLAAAEPVMDRHVPTCPDWTVDDLVFHVGSVFAHKLAALREGQRPEEWSQPGDDASPQDDLDWCRAMHGALIEELSRRRPDEPAWTWWGPEQTVGFWQRRMALETAVHRADAQLAAGSHVTPIDGDLARDGIDEFVSVMLAGADVPAQGPADVGGPGSGRVQVVIDGTVVAGQASDLLLWLWGRVDDEAVAGDRLTEVRAVLREAAQ